MAAKNVPGYFTFFFRLAADLGIDNNKRKHKQKKNERALCSWYGTSIAFERKSLNYLANTVFLY